METGNLIDYKVYNFTIAEKVLYFLLYFIAGGLVGFVFYGNLFTKDGELTIYSMISNAVVFVIMGSIGVKMFYNARKEQMIAKRKEELRLQFRETLASLSTAFTSGENPPRAFISAEHDMLSQFGDKSDIVRELREINAGVYSNQRLDLMLLDLAKRSGIEDIEDFANVFQVCFQQGGNINSVVRHSYDLIGDKMAINQEIQTKITSNQMQQKIMSVMPILMIAFLRFSSSSFAESFASFKGVTAMTVAAVIFIFSYNYGKKITDIKG